MRSISPSRRWCPCSPCRRSGITGEGRDEPEASCNALRRQSSDIAGVSARASYARRGDRKVKRLPAVRLLSTFTDPRCATATSRTMTSARPAAFPVAGSRSKSHLARDRGMPGPLSATLTTISSTDASQPIWTATIGGSSVLLRARTCLAPTRRGAAARRRAARAALRTRRRRPRRASRAARRRRSLR